MIQSHLRSHLFTLLPNISLFGAWREEDVDYFIRPLDGRRVEAGEILFQEGDLPSSFYLLLEGEINLEVGGGIITTLGEGDVLGAEAMIGIQRHAVTAIARTAGVVLVIPPRAIHRLSKYSSAVFGMMMFNLARDFARMLSRSRSREGGTRRPRRRTPVRSIERRLPRRQDSMQVLRDRFWRPLQ